MDESSMDESSCNNDSTASLLADDSFPLNTVDAIDSSIDWDNRAALQNQWTPQEKGWLVSVEWKQTEYGLGVFAAQDIRKGTKLRFCKLHRNLIVFSGPQDIANFLGSPDSSSYAAKVRYLSDYLFGCPVWIDAQGKEILQAPKNQWLHCILIPGFGLNHIPTHPNVRVEPLQFECQPHRVDVVVLTAIVDIDKGDELRNSYQDFGPAPDFIKEFAKQHNVSLVYQGCNHFV